MDGYIMNKRILPLVLLSATLLYAPQLSAMMTCHKYQNGTGQWHCDTQIQQVHFYDDNQVYLKGESISFGLNIDENDFKQIDKEINIPQPIAETDSYRLMLIAQQLIVKGNSGSISVAMKGQSIKAFFSANERNIIALSQQEIKILGPKNGHVTFKRTPENCELIPNEWFRDVAISPNGTKLAILTTKNNVHVVDVSKITDTTPSLQTQQNETLQLTYQEETTTSDNVSWWKKCWNKIVRDPIPTLLTATAITGIAGYALYKWKPHWVKKCFSKFKLSF